MWGAPNNNRTLGNGTFASDLGTTQLPQPPSKPGPGPIAPPSARSNIQTGAPVRQPPIGPIGPPKPAVSEKEAQRNAWTNAVQLSDDAFRNALNAEFDEREQQLQQEGRTLADIQPAIKDTWRPTHVDNSGTRNETAPKQALQLSQDNTWAASDTKPALSRPVPTGPSEHSQRAHGNIAGRDAATTASLMHATHQARSGSRFFPTRDVRQEALIETQRPKSPSPPPPDMAGHPAFDGDVSHPHVSLPRPHPIVKLPPTIRAAASEPRPVAAIHEPKPHTPSFAWASTGAYKEHEHPSAGSPRGLPHKPENEWQAKIDNLLGIQKAHSPPKPVGVESASRSAYEHTDQAATVLLSRCATPVPAADGSVTTKDMAESCFEGQEMGSLPFVRLPSESPELALQPCPPPKPLPRKFLVDSCSADVMTFPLGMTESGNAKVWRVMLPGQPGDAKTIVVPFSNRAPSNPRRGGTPRGGRHPSAPHHRQNKGRESSTYTIDSASSVSGSSTPHQPSNRPRGGFRGRDSSWTSSRPATAIQT